MSETPDDVDDLDDRCDSCGRAPGPGKFCMQCGASQTPGARRGFAASPNQRAYVPEAVSTLFPYLARAEHVVFRLLLLGGAALIVGLALGGLYPVALIAAAVLVPLIVVLYIRDIDIYEEEPFHVLALTIAWGAAVGVLAGLLRNATHGTDAALMSQTSHHAVLWNGLLLPLIGFALALGGPLYLLVYPKFNDVLDGVTFGAASAVAFSGAELLTHSTTLLAAGMRPVGLAEPWTVRLVTLGIVLPILWGATVGCAAAACWLRWRSPARDRNKLGALGNPFLAAPLAAAVVVAAGLVQLYLSRWWALAALTALAAAVVIWLRLLIQIGLVQEAVEATEAPPALCPNCKQTAPRAAFCSNCGVATRALPGDAERVRSSQKKLVLRFVVGLGVLVGAGAGIIAAVQPGAAHSPCATGFQGCATPPTTPSNGGPGTPGSKEKSVTWKGSTGVELTYDANAWSVAETSPEKLVLTYNGQLALQFETTETTETSQSLLDGAVSSLRGRYPDLTVDTGHPLTGGAAIGTVKGVGEMLAGHDSVDGAPVEVLAETATRSGAGVVVTAWTTQQAHSSSSGIATPFDVFVNADAVLESFQWNGSAK